MKLQNAFRSSLATGVRWSPSGVTGRLRGCGPHYRLGRSGEVRALLDGFRVTLTPLTDARRLLNRHHSRGRAQALRAQGAAVEPAAGALLGRRQAFCQA
jgi:hypothetical protein